MSMDTCLIPECKSARDSRGLCKDHYMAARRRGLPKIAADDRFWARVEKVTGCWLWQGHLTRDGYGFFGDKGRHLVHRWSYERFVGAIPAGLEIDHLCRVRNCVNPAHLEPVTPAENRHRQEAYTRESCINGHEFTPENTSQSGGRRRRCRACQRAYAAKYRASQRAVLATSLIDGAAERLERLGADR